MDKKHKENHLNSTRKFASSSADLPKGIPTIAISILLMALAIEKTFSKLKILSIKEFYIDKIRYETEKIPRPSRLAALFEDIPVSDTLFRKDCFHICLLQDML